MGLFHNLNSCFHYQTSVTFVAQPQQNLDLISVDACPVSLPFLVPILVFLQQCFLTVPVTGKRSRTTLRMWSTVLFSTSASYALMLNVPINKKLCQSINKEAAIISRQPSSKYGSDHLFCLSKKCFLEHSFFLCAHIF